MVVLVVVPVAGALVLLMPMLVPVMAALMLLMLMPVPVAAARMLLMSMLVPAAAARVLPMLMPVVVMPAADGAGLLLGPSSVLWGNCGAAGTGAQSGLK